MNDLSALDDLAREVDRMRELVVGQQRQINHLVAAAQFTMDHLDHLTSDDFSKGGDRPARQVLAEALHYCRQLDHLDRREYGL